MTADLLDKKLSAGEDDVRRYLREIRSYPLLTPEQERELARRCAQGDEEAIRTMVNSNLRLVVSVAREYAGRGVPMMDLVQEGSIGLLAAAERFDYTLNFRFSTYATKWIRQGVTRCLANHGIIRVPTYTAQMMSRIQSARNAHLREKGVEPTVEELVAACDLPADKVEKLLQLTPEVCSLDAPAGEEAGALGLLLENPAAEQPYETLVREELSCIMDALLQTLDARQQRLLRLRFGLEDGTCCSLEQIGKILGVSKERARQIEKQAIGKLKKSGQAKGLEDFLE